MIIDLSGWNEYTADDVLPGPIPCGIKFDYEDFCKEVDNVKRFYKRKFEE